MKLTISAKVESPLLKRTEVEGEVVYDAQTPSKNEVRKQLSTSLKADEKLIVVKHLYTRYGDRKGQVFAYVYQSHDALATLEPRKKKGKEDKKAETPAAEKPAEKKEEKKADAAPAEKKEEKKDAAEAPKEEAQKK